MEIKAVLFDLFDTLVLIKDGDAFYEPALRHLYASLRKDKVSVAYDQFRDAYFEVRDQSYERTLKTLEEPHFNVRVAQTLKTLGFNYLASDSLVMKATLAFTDELSRHLQLDEEARGTLEQLDSKYKMGIISNFAIAEYPSKLLTRYHLKDFFEVVMVSGSINRRKPSVEIFQFALRYLAVEAAQTVFVGDTLNVDIKGAKNAGMKAVLIARTSAAKDNPTSYVWKPHDSDVPDPDAVITRLSDLPEVLAGL